MSDNDTTTTDTTTEATTETEIWKHANIACVATTKRRASSGGGTEMSLSSLFPAAILVDSSTMKPVEAEDSFSENTFVTLRVPSWVVFKGLTAINVFSPSRASDATEAGEKLYPEAIRDALSDEAAEAESKETALRRQLAKLQKDLADAERKTNAARDALEERSK